MQLGRDYPALRADEGGVNTPKSLAARAHVLPVLDGLDELPDAARVKTITALNGSLGANDQLILTSRTSEFAAAVGEEGNVLRSAAVIEPQALSPDAVASYLESCLPPRFDSAWPPILSAIRDGRARALADITATPLGTWLLRTVYITARRSPAPLRQRRLNNPQALRAHLFDELIPALISSRTPTRDPGEIYRPQLEWDPEDVRRWLGFHAWTLNQVNEIAPDHGRDLIWWRLAGLTLHPFIIGLCTSVLGLFAGLIFGGAVGLGSGLVSGTRIGLIGALITGPGMGLAMAAMVGLLANVSWIFNSPGYANLRISRRKSASKQRIEASNPWQKMTSPFWIALFAALVTALPVFAGRIAASLLAGLVTGFLVWLGLWLMRWAETPLTTDRAITPISSWRADRTLILFRITLTVIVFGVAFWLGAWLDAGGKKHTPTYAFAWMLAGLGIGLFFGVTMGNHHAWLLFSLFTFWLTLPGLLGQPSWAPHRLMRFLDDAHRLGLLRAVGPIYQFRHVEIQDHLAASFSRRYLYGRRSGTGRDRRAGRPTVVELL